MSKQAFTATDVQVAPNSVMGKSESPVGVHTLAAYGAPRMSVTHDQADKFNHTWLRFSQESAELQAHLQAYGWRYSGARRKGWHRVTDAQSQAFVDALVGTKASAPKTSKPKPQEKAATQAPKPTPAQVTPAPKSPTSLAELSVPELRARIDKRMSEIALLLDELQSRK